MNSNGPDSRSKLLSLLRIEVIRGDFVLSSGRRSSYYIDARRVTLSGVGSRLVGEVLFGRLGHDRPDAVAGMSLGADPLVTAVTVASAYAGAPIDGLLVRKRAKEHGTGRRVEGPRRPGMRVVVLEDTSTTGGSALEAVQALRDEGAAIERVITLIDREEGAAEAISASGLTFEAVFAIDEIVPAPDRRR